MQPIPSQRSPLARLPFYYGWAVVVIAFITMGLGVNARISFSLLFPPILDEFGWTRGATAGFFAVGFLVSSVMSPLIGMAMDRLGPRLVFPFGGVIVACGLILGTYASQPWHFFVTLGALVVGGSVIIAYIGHSAFLPNWFVRRRGLAIGIAFSGVGVFGMVMLPWMQTIIDNDGWRAACWTLAILVLVTVVPLNLLCQRRRPQDLGLRPDGDAVPADQAAADQTPDNVVDKAWADTDWTLRRAMATSRFWWLGGAFFCALYAYYAVQVHQTKYLLEIGFSSEEAAFALGLVGLFGVAGLLVLGHLSDRIGREWAWSIACVGFASCYGLLILMGSHSAPWLVYPMVAAQGLLGYGMSPNYAAIPAELFQGRHYGTIFGTLSLAATIGGAAGPWLTGYLFDRYQSYEPAFWLALVLSALSILCVWMAAPRKVRAVAGRIPRRA
ncbi:MAG: MFS transporter [Alphaproteobacteria bacterium]|jgi:MFS family permease|nr:MFS transporter [Alphaproteobacteria bacterium]MDP6815420.1 MFS transporter [Alphaproteobacteria bacterium]